MSDKDQTIVTMAIARFTWIFTRSKSLVYGLMASALWGIKLRVRWRMKSNVGPIRVLMLYRGTGQ